MHVQNDYEKMAGKSLSHVEEVWKHSSDFGGKTT
jgi:hypothetical protein